MLSVKANGIYAKVLLASSELAEQIQSVQSTAGNPQLIEGIYRLYFDEDSQVLKKGAAGKGAGSARRLRDFIGQIRLTYDLNDCSPQQFLDLLPNEFNRFKQKLAPQKQKGTVLRSVTAS